MTSMAAVPRQLRGHARLARSRGWTITTTGSGHLLWRPPDGPAVFTPSNLNDSRSLANATAKLRRAGLPCGRTPQPGSGNRT